MNEDILKILGQQELPLESISKVLKMSLKTHQKLDYMVIFDMYNYGVIQGKRAERARNKKRLQLLKSRQVEFYCKDNSFANAKKQKNVG